MIRRFILGFSSYLSWWMCPVSLRRMYILMLGEVARRRPLCPVAGWCCCVQLCPYWFSAWWICPFLIEGCGHHQLYSGFIHSSLQFYQFLPDIVWHLIVGLLGDLTSLPLGNTQDSPFWKWGPRNYPSLSKIPRALLPSRVHISQDSNS